MPKDPGAVTAHVTKLAQNQEAITTLVLSRRQMFALVAALTTGLREGAEWKEGFHLSLPTKMCQSPACAGGDAALHLVRPGKRAANPKA